VTSALTTAAGHPVVAGPLRVYPRAPADHRPHSIAAVSPGGPADKAGITAGSVVTRVDDRVIPNGNSLVAPNGNSLVAAIRSHAPGDTISLTVQDSASGTHTVQVTLQGITVKAGK